MTDVTKADIKWMVKGLILIVCGLLFVMTVNWLLWGKFSYGN